MAYQQRWVEPRLQFRSLWSMVPLISIPFCLLKLWAESRMLNYTPSQICFVHFVSDNWKLNSYFSYFSFSSLSNSPSYNSFSNAKDDIKSVHKIFINTVVIITFYLHLKSELIFIQWMLIWTDCSYLLSMLIVQCVCQTIFCSTLYLRQIHDQGV